MNKYNLFILKKERLCLEKMVKDNLETIET